MPSLSIVRTDFIKIAKWVGIILAIIVLIFIVIKLGFFIKEKIWPTPPAKPTAGFNKLPAQFFPNGVENKFTYRIDTVSGELPQFSDKVKVYKMEKPIPDLSAVERATEKLRSMGFDETPEQLSDRVFRWKNPGPPEKIVTLNVDNNEFNLNSLYLSDPEVLSGLRVPTEEEAISTSEGLLRSMELLNEDIDSTKTKTKLLRLKNGAILSANSLSNTNIINVYFFQKNKDELPIVYPQGYFSPISVTVSAGSNGPQIIDSRYFYQKSLKDSHTYPISTATQALEKLKKGEGYIASYDGTDKTIKIKDVYLAYYSEGREQDYLMPVIVFESINNFIAFIPAITDEWIDK